MDFGNAYHVLRELGMTAERRSVCQGGADRDPLEPSRGALVMLVLARVLGLAWRLVRDAAVRAARRGSPRLRCATQSRSASRTSCSRCRSLLAAAHNAGAALLLAVLVVINFASAATLQRRSPDDHQSRWSAARIRFGQFYQLTKPRVVSLIVFYAR